MRDYFPLICKDCRIEIFADINMVMIKDYLWENICDSTEDALCDNCMEKRLGWKITHKDFKPSNDPKEKMIKCNRWWLENKKRHYVS